MKVCTVSQMRAMDKKAIEEFGIKGELLMENAGHAAYEALRKESKIIEKRFLVFCGTGNNGGDGCVLARKIHADGGRVKVFVLGDPGRFKGAAGLNFKIVKHLPIELQHVLSMEDLQEDILRCDFIVDAIFGTGLSREVKGIYRDVIEKINKSGKPILSIDIPSGVHGDSGRVLGIAVKADTTVTFGLPKYGNVLFPGSFLGGKLYVSHISFPPEMYNADHLRVSINTPSNFLLHEMEKQAAEPFKALYLLGPSDFGATTLQKLGKGTIILAVKSSIRQNIAENEDRISKLLQKEPTTGSLIYHNKQDLLKYSTLSDIVILGPGLSLDVGVQEFGLEWISSIEKPLLVSRDNIYRLNDPQDFSRSKGTERAFLVGIDELSYIVKQPVQEVEVNKIHVLQQAAERMKSTVVLLDSRLLIGFPDRRVVINPTGPTSIAAGKLWEGLDGTIAAMVSFGLSLQDAIKLGGFIQGLAGDLIAEKGLENEWTHQNMLTTLPHAMRLFQDGLNTDLANRYAGAILI